ncbi:hypothetical protein DNU06_14325 [Putridiphycobacter roseus]|uniref:Uncharacterized protein n=1 Tax=Putridiphycobacter roseus TaxID=2219161 RepID=A0A2W1MY73_9FLAO|nr:CotH kinase family protein [Putridiphycobacter roseus]PZE16140.1 hypothetical protein DNU06_14325 [Putridiphycobacter roseus]
MKIEWSAKVNWYFALVFFCFQFGFYTSGQVITEICPSNKLNYNHPIEGFVDWVEIYNPTVNDINLLGYVIVDLNDPTKKWTIYDTVLTAGSFMVFPANSNSSSNKTIHFNFPKSGGRIAIASSQYLMIDSINYPPMQIDHSYGKLGLYFDQPTPQNSNQLAIGYKGYAQKPSIRVEENKQGKVVQLASIQDDAKIRYSLNGSNPVNGALYTHEIVVEENTSFVVTALLDSFLPADFLFYNIFVNPPKKLPIVNLTVDSLALFDELTGLYMLGPNANTTSPYAGANFWKDTALDVHYAYYNNLGQIREERQCVLKMHGGAGSRTKAMKPLQLIIKNYHDEATFDYPYFQGKSFNSYQKLILRNSGNDFGATMMRDGLIHDYIQQNMLDIDVLGYHPVVVYINGNYLGIHNIREKIDVDYIKANYHTDSGVNILENHYLSVVNGSAATFNHIVNYANGHDLKEEGNINWIKDRLDIPSMVDYFIIESFIYNKDWPNNNLKLWNAAQFPKWRYLCYDLDVSLNYFWGFDLPDKQYLKYLLTQPATANVHIQLLKNLLDNAEFKRYFINRYADLLNTIFQPNRLKEFVVGKKTHIELDMKKHCDAWNQSYENWHKNVFYLISFFNARAEMVSKEIANTFNKPTAVEISLNIYPYLAGAIQINSLLIDSFPFVGKYYPKNEIDLEAIAFKDHVFHYWLNNRTGEKFYASKIRVNPTELDDFIAVFSPDEDVFNLVAFPNPTSNQITINFSIPNTSTFSLRIIDLSGKLVKEVMQEEIHGVGVYETAIFLNGLMPGTYLLSLKSEYGYKAIPIVKW